MPALSLYLKTNRKDVALMAAAAAMLLLATVIVSGKRPLWYDEVYSWTLVTDVSFGHMMYALRMAAESPPGLYHVLARAWLAVTGESVLALRLFSTAADIVALVAIWTTLRRAFSLRATAVGVLTVFCTSAMMLFHSAEARFYPLFVACTALAIATYARAVETEKLDRKLAVGLLLSNVALVQAHVYGVAYSAALLLALICCDASVRRFRPRIYAGIAATWLTLLPWLPTLRRVNEATKPRHWIEPPTAAAIFEFYRLYSLELPVVLLAVAVLCLVARWRFAVATKHVSAQRTTIVVAALMMGAVATLHSYPPMLDIALLGLLVVLAGDRAPRQDERSELRRALMIAAIILVAAAPAAGIFSLVVKPVFVPKYVLPSMLGMAILLAWMAESASRFPLPPRAAVSLKAGWAALLVALLAMPVVSAVRQEPHQPPLYGIRAADIAAIVPRGVPVAVENFHLFLPLQQQAPTAGYFYVGDQEAASSERADRSALLHYRGAELWKDLGYLSASAPDWHEFLAGHPSFAVLHSPGHFWFEWRLRNNPEYTWRSVGRIGVHEVLLVERRARTKPSGTLAAASVGLR